MSVKMVKEKHGSSKGPGVIQLCRKSVKRVKFSEMDDAKKQCSKRPPLESICELLSTISSSSSLEMSSEEVQIFGESSSSRMPRKAFTTDNEANENTNHDNQYEKMVPRDGRKWHLSKTIKNFKHNKELLYKIQYGHAMACILVSVLHACIWDTLVITHAYLDCLFFLHNTTSHDMNALPSEMRKMYQDKVSQKETMHLTST